MIYGAALNFKGAMSALGAAVHQPPYGKPPEAPILYIKPPNTRIGSGAPIPCPEGVGELRMGGTLGVVLGRRACKIAEADALSYVGGYCAVNDVSIPHASYYRPAIREQCRDGFCAVSDQVSRIADPLEIRISVNGELRAVNNTANLIRGVAKLIADVTAFMTLEAGDILLVGEPENAPVASRGDRVRVEIEGVGAVENTIVPEQVTPSAPRKPDAFTRRARVLRDGQAATISDIDDDGSVTWLPPVEPGTIFALGLNYADHARELSFKPPEHPLVFLKGPGTLVGHRGHTPRPVSATYMHYECELAVVIGSAARRVKRDDAYAYVAGYTVANDYAIRDYLENYYRPNLRVKNRDASTPIGPWLVSAAAFPDPMNLHLRTTVNGRVTQEGSTRDMIFSIPVLIEYLSGFMTLSPGDIILTGTPEGTVGVHAGDEVVTEIEGIGQLTNYVDNE